MRKEQFWLFKKTQRKIYKNTLRRVIFFALQERYLVRALLESQIGSLESVLRYFTLGLFKVALAINLLHPDLTLRRANVFGSLGGPNR